MDIKSINEAIKQLNEMEATNSSKEEKILFEQLKNNLLIDAPLALKNQLLLLKYDQYEDSFWDDKVYKNFDGIKKLIKFYEEKLFENIPSESKEDLYKKKLVKAKNTNIDFFERLGCMVVGDDPCFTYRSSMYITRFFNEAGFPELRHDGSTRRLWAAKQLEQMNIDDLYSILKCLLKKQYFPTNVENPLDREKAKETLKNLISSSCENEDVEDIGDIFDINVNTSLLFNKTIETKDNTLNDDMEQARRFYTQGDLQTALEKIWDAFERIKSLFHKEKKESISLIINILSDEIKSSNSPTENNPEYLFFNKEMQGLTEIGNTYKIRHSEIKQIVIINEQTKEYLFFKVLNLINLIYIRMNEINKQDLNK